ncbi:hypothetical protein D9M71_512340 [compost metagenome]
MPHQQGIGQHEPGEHRVQLRIALQNGHPLVIAQLEAGDDVYDQVPEQQRNGQHPHHGVTVVRPGDRRGYQISCPQPRQHRDDAGAKQSDQLCQAILRGCGSFSLDGRYARHGDSIVFFVRAGRSRSQ